MNFSFREGSKQAINYNEVCPHCERSVTPISVSGYINQKYNHEVYALTECPSCGKPTLHIGGQKNNKASSCTFYDYEPKKLTQHSFHTEIVELYPDFVRVYQEAYKADQLNLLEVCGMGYRKAFEFLIKSYCLLNKEVAMQNLQRKPKTKIPELKRWEEYVSHKNLGFLIKNCFSAPRVIAVMERAAWIGNDETHFKRKHENHDKETLKILISLSVNFIHDEYVASKFIEEIEPK